MNKSTQYRIGLNVIMILLILGFTLANVQNIALLYKADAIAIYVHTILFNGIVFSAIAFNNLYLIPKLLFNKKQFLYIVALIGLILVSTILSNLYLQYLMDKYPSSTLDNYTIIAIDMRLNDIQFLEMHLATFVHNLFYILSFAIAFILKYMYIKNKNLQYAREEHLKAELNVLKAQVNPHFLFNMMNSIYSLALNKSNEAPETILKLSEILRYNLYETKANFVPLSKELNIIKTYINLESIRINHPEKISFENNVTSTDITIPPMLLLPIIENAFKHGIESSISQGFVHIRAHETADSFIFECSNNYKTKNTKNINSGIGLENLKRRLQLIYPEKHTLKIHKTEILFEVVLKINTKQ